MFHSKVDFLYSLQMSPHHLTQCKSLEITLYFLIKLAFSIHLQHAALQLVLGRREEEEKMGGLQTANKYSLRSFYTLFPKPQNCLGKQLERGG